MGELNIPLESAKSGCSLRCAANMPEAHSVAHKDRERDEAGEPEQHREALDGKDHHGIVELALGEAHGYQDQVGQGEDGEDGAEEEEADLRRRSGIPVAAPPVGDCEVLVSCCTVGHRGDEQLP